MPNVFHLIINPKSLEYYEDIKRYVTGLKYFQYMRCVEHIGQEEKHYHLVLQLSKSMPKLSTTKLHGAHIKPKTYGSTKALIDYINCEDEEHKKKGVTYELVDEIGEYRPQGGYKVKDLLEYKNVEDLPDYKMVNTWKRLKLDQNNKLSIKDYRKKVKVYYIQGPSGIGKTEKALQLISDLMHEYGEFFNEVKYTNGFWTGCTDDCKIALYDDWRDSHMFPSEFINFIDYNKHNMNIKGGCIKNNYELIIITSIMNIDDIYSEYSEKNNYEPCKQWKRRIEVIDMFPKQQVYLGGLPISGKSNTDRINELKKQYNI